jgi:hypothetical protein
VNPRPIWGDVPASQSLIYALMLMQNDQSGCRIGWLANANESAVYTNFASEPDPAADDLHCI